MALFWEILYFFCIFLLLVQVPIWALCAWTWQRMPKKKEEKASEMQALTVLICARNEEENLRRYLPLWLEQDYPEAYQVLVVDDASTDDSLAFLQELAAKHGQLDYLHLPEKKGKGKRPALQAGIGRAKYPWLLLSDADCWPEGGQFLRKMMQARGTRDIVLGLSPYEPSPTYLSAWIAAETHYTALLFVAAAARGQAYMGLGRNILYRKAVLEQTPWANYAELAAGDDDLSLNYWAQRKDIAICIEAGAKTISQAPQTWAALYRQKKRHYGVAHYYPWRHKITLALIQAGLALSWPLLLGSTLASSQPLWPLWALASLLFSLQAWAWMASAQKIEGKKKLNSYIFFSIFVPMYLMVFLPSVLLQSPTKWK